MEGIYKIISTFIQSHYHESEIDSLNEYFLWLRDYITLDLPMNMSSKNIQIIFPCSSGETVLNDLLEKLMELSKPSYQEGGSVKPSIDLKVSDMDSEMDYIESCSSKRVIKWMGDRDNDSGFFYTVLDLDDKLFLKAYAELRELIEGHPELKDKINRKRGYLGLDANSDLDVCDLIDWDDMMYEYSDKFTHLVFNQIKEILDGLILIVCSDSFYTIDGGEGESFYIIAGYNPKEDYGEGLIIRDFSY